jgi:Polyketide cyclase / dehydrase and lipid transport
MKRWHDLESADEGFFESAPFVHRYPMDLPVSVEQVWSGLVGDKALSWCRSLSSVQYTSEPPHHVGTTRTAKTTGGVLVLRERFFRWEEGTRKSFCVQQANLPMFRRFAEDYLVEPTDKGCRFTWTFAYEPTSAWKLFFTASRPVSAGIFGSFARDTKRHFGVQR